MKKIFICFLISVFGTANAQTTFTWTGLGVTNNFSDGLNWSALAPPTATNSILFDGTGLSGSKDCIFDVAVSALGMSVTSGYTGSITFSNSAVSFTGNLSQAGGTITSTSDTLKVTTGSILKSGGTFNHNSGSVVLHLMTIATTSLTGNLTFNRLILRPNTVAGQKNLHFFSTTTETMSVQSGTFGFAYLGTLAIRSMLDLRGAGNMAPAPNTGTFTLGGTGNFTLSSLTNATSRDRLPNVIFNTTGNIVLSNFISIDGNWTHVAGNFLPGNSTVNFYGNRSILGNGNAFNKITVQASSTLNFPANTEVKLAGSLEIASTGNVIFPSTSLLGFNGTVTQAISPFAATQTITLGSIRVYQTNTRSINLSGGAGVRYRLLDSLKIDGGTTTFNTNDKLTLMSSAGLKARIARIGSAAASVTGSVTVQTIIPGGFTGWANLGVPGVRGQTVKSWDTYSTSAGANGVPMTCNGCSWSETSVAGGPFTSIQSWAEATNTYSNLTATTPLNTGQGYWVYVGNGQVTTSDLMLVNTGTVVQGNINIPVTAASSGYNLVSNPYPCAVNWSTVVNASSNIENAIYIWNADIGETSFIAGVSSHTSGGANNIIPAGQGFHVQAKPGGGTVSFTEASKVSSSTSANPLLKQSSGNGEVGTVFRLQLTDKDQFSDFLAFRIHPNATSSFDGSLDARKSLQTPGYAGYPGPYTKYTTISSRDNNGNDYSIHSIPPLTHSVVVPIMVRVSSSGTYSIQPLGVEELGTCIYLKDKVTGTYHDLKKGQYVFTITDTTYSPRFELLLCQQFAENPNSIGELLTGNMVFISQDHDGAFVQTSFTANTRAVISAYNVVGQKLMDDMEVQGTELLTRIPLDLKNQVVIIKVSTANEVYTKKILLH